MDSFTIFVENFGEEDIRAAVCPFFDGGTPDYESLGVMADWMEESGKSDLVFQLARCLSDIGSGREPSFDIHCATDHYLRQGCNLIIPDRYDFSKYIFRRRRAICRVLVSEPRRPWGRDHVPVYKNPGENRRFQTAADSENSPWGDLTMIQIGSLMKEYALDCKVAPIEDVLMVAYCLTRDGV